MLIILKSISLLCFLWAGIAGCGGGQAARDMVVLHDTLPLALNPNVIICDVKCDSGMPTSSLS